MRIGFSVGKTSPSLASFFDSDRLVQVGWYLAQFRAPNLSDLYSPSSLASTHRLLSSMLATGGKNLRMYAADVRV